MCYSYIQSQADPGLASLPVVDSFSSPLLLYSASAGETSKGFVTARQFLNHSFYSMDAALVPISFVADFLQHPSSSPLWRGLRLQQLSFVFRSTSAIVAGFQRR